MVSERTGSKVCSWKIKRDLVTSYHVLIETVMGNNNNRIEKKRQRWSLRRYWVGRADWEGYMTALSVVASELGRATDRGATLRKAWDLQAAVH